MPDTSGLIIFTYSYPYGFGEEWKYNEFNVLAKHFEHVVIQPYTYGSSKDNQRALPSNFTLNEPLISKPLTTLQLLSRGIFNLAPVQFALKELIERRLYTNFKHLRFWLNSTLIVRYLASHTFIKQLINQRNSDTILYFYWGTGPALIIPILNPENFSKIIAKFHGGDLYEERSNGYLPFRRGIFSKLTNALFISEQGLNYASRKYRIKHGKLFRLGVVAQGLANYSTDNVLRVVSCSSAIPVKRLSLLLKALFHVQYPIVWTHIGDGPLLSSLQDAASTLPNHIKTKFLGFVPANKVQSFYKNNAVDLFINVSESEGIPVSIMEAFSAGIPVLATDVGGTHEILNNGNGKLLAPDISEYALAEEISNFYNMPLLQRKTLREGAFQAFKEKSNAEKLYEDLAQFLLH